MVFLLDPADEVRHFGELAPEGPLRGVAVAVPGEERPLDELRLGLLPRKPRDAAQMLVEPPLQGRRFVVFFSSISLLRRRSRPADRISSIFPEFLSAP